MRTLQALLCIGILTLHVAAQAATLPVPPPLPTTFSLEQLAETYGRITRTGVGRDAIPALYRPAFLSVSDASLSMEGNDVVFVVEYPTGLVRIYPQRIMVWHEVVNDVLPDPAGGVIRNDTPLSALDGFCITYSPLTGTVAAFYAMSGRFPTSFGTTGNLLNTNSLLYDRATESVWSQLMGTALDGPQAGKRLSRIQVLWTRWGPASRRWPDAQVLSRSTGYKRSYGKDPYGSYQTSGTYYDDLRLLYPVTRVDNRLPPKKQILGLEQEGIFGAVDKDEVREAGVVNIALGLTPLLAMHDPDLDAVRVFSRDLDGHAGPLSFILFEGRVVDEQTRSEWDAEGNCVSGRFRGRQLKPFFSLDAMWFSWAAFYPGTVILPEKTFIRPGLGR